MSATSVETLKSRPYMSSAFFGFDSAFFDEDEDDEDDEMGADALVEGTASEEEAGADEAKNVDLRPSIIVR